MRKTLDLEVGWGGRIIRPCGPHPFGAVRGALTRVTARTNQPPQRDRQHWPLHRAPRTLSFPSWHSPRATRERFLWLVPSDMAGVEGFEPPNGGSKIVTSIINKLLKLMTGGPPLFISATC